ncbi:YeeE/YedE family protein [Sneathiella glossodoripedis]|uniref:YeeE/YedE family protein n=1 Tax=Sneathiella glossodoripedis TaxID=418853 RepID=UPI000470328E|nr:YeeE/YedE thiosulfate transporter family protein [Sneathiella glossodoripedis]
MENFTPFTSLSGGIILGISATLLLMSGRIAGISGILGGLIPPASDDKSWRVLFLIGLVTGAALFPLVGGDTDYIDVNPYNFEESIHYGILVLAGLLVGAGTNIGAGCTSGHGICGLGRLSARSLVATLSFMASAIIVVFVIRQITGG